MSQFQKREVNCRFRTSSIPLGLPPPQNCLGLSSSDANLNHFLFLSVLAMVQWKESWIKLLVFLNCNLCKESVLTFLRIKVFSKTDMLLLKWVCIILIKIRFQLNQWGNKFHLLEWSVGTEVQFVLVDDIPCFIFLFLMIPSASLLAWTHVCVDICECRTWRKLCYPSLELLC